MHQLYIDIGNSYFKAARKEGVDWRVVKKSSRGDGEEFISWVGGLSEDRITLCSVDQRITGDIKKRVPPDHLHVLTYKDIPPDLIEYKTPKTLGMDRFIACFGASVQSPGSVVVIDAGSACTIDFMERGFVYQGGVIMPGLNLFITSLARELPSLPEPDTLLPDKWPGLSTIDSLRWGTTGAYFAAIKNFLQKFKDRFGSYDLFVTGGEAEIIQRYLGGDFNLRKRPYLVFEGMQSFRDRYLVV